MTFRIDIVPDESRRTLILAGGLGSAEVQDLKARFAELGDPAALDLCQVRLVDLDAVRFLAAAERRGIELYRVPTYVREWIQIERSRLSEFE
jgi:hypothetical protein